MEVLVPAEELESFLNGLVEDESGKYRQVFVPVRAPDDSGGCFLLSPLQPGIDYSLDDYRSVDPAKVLFYLFREQVSGTDYPGGERLVVGVKACDLKALQLLDRALLSEDFKDPAYLFWREHTTVISSDCTSLHPTCHCNLTEGTPWAEEGFDVNLSRLGDDYLMFSGSSKGESFLEEFRKTAYCLDPGEISINGIEERRASMMELLEDQNGKGPHPALGGDLRNTPGREWEIHSEGCVGCGGCTNICPTCYCLILNDESKEERFVKERSYDSCQLDGYATVAGGGTPRPTMTDRFRNRYICKLQLMERNFGIFGCTGCGRCIEVCPAGIDIRQVSRESVAAGEKRPPSSSDAAVHSDRGV